MLIVDRERCDCQINRNQCSPNYEIKGVHNTQKSILLICIYSIIGPLHDLLELLPSRMLSIKLPPVIRQEEQGESRKQHSPGGPPQRHVIQQSTATYPVVNYGRRQLHIERNRIRVITVVIIHHRQLLKHRLNLDTRIRLGPPSQKVVRQDLRLHHSEIDSDPFIETRNHKEVVQQIVVTVVQGRLLGNRSRVRQVLHEEKESTEITEVVQGIVRDTAVVGRCVVTVGHLHTGVGRRLRRVQQSGSQDRLTVGTQNIVKFLGSFIHPIYFLKISLRTILICNEVIRNRLVSFSSLRFGEQCPIIGKEVVISRSLVGEATVHKGDSEVGQLVGTRVEGCAVVLLDERVVDGELDEVIDDVGEEKGEEDNAANDGGLGRHRFVFGNGNEGKDVDGPQETNAQMGLPLVNERTSRIVRFS